MNEFWNLDPMYKGFDDPAFESDLVAAKEKIDALEALMDQLTAMEPACGLRDGIAMQEQISDLLGKLVQYAMLRQNANTKDTEAGSNVGRVLALYSRMAAPAAAFQDWAAKLPDLMELVLADEKLKNYEFMFRNMQEDVRYLLPG